MAWRPVLSLLLIAPFFGEVLSTATPPLSLLLPWNLVLFAALYGGGALLCREVAFRCGLGRPGLALLGAAYGVFEEAIVDRFWFDAGYAQRTGVGHYSEVGHTNVLLATHLTVFHAVVSVSSSVLIVSWLFPGDRDRAWVPRRGPALAAAAMLLVLFVTFEDYVRPPLGPLVVAIALGALFVVAAFLSRRLPRRTNRRSRPRSLAVLAFACTAAHFLLVYALPSTGLVWPAGLAVAVTPIVIGVVTGRRWTGGARGRDALWIVTGIVGFFILLDALVGLGGRYDFTVAAVLMALGAVRLHRRNSRQVRPVCIPASPGHGAGQPRSAAAGCWSRLLAAAPAAVMRWMKAVT